MLEAEMGYVDSVHSIMDNAEQCVKVKHKITQPKPLGIPFLKVEKFYRIIYVSNHCLSKKEIYELDLNLIVNSVCIF